MEEEKTKRSVPWSVFVWAIGILLVLFLSAMTMSGNALSKAGDNSGDIKETQTNIDWIKGSLERIEKSIGD